MSYNQREVNGDVWLRVPCTELPQHHIEEATRLMLTLPHAGWLSEEVEPGLHYLVIDCAIENADYGSMLGDLLSRGRPCMLSVNGMKERHLGYYPFPLCIEKRE